MMEKEWERKRETRSCEGDEHNTTTIPGAYHISTDDLLFLRLESFSFGQKYPPSHNLKILITNTRYMALAHS